jgi:hypothetical protein
MSKINAVKFKDKQSFEKNKIKSNVIAVHEPFGVVVFEDETPVVVNTAKVSHTSETQNGIEVPTGLALLITNKFAEAFDYLKKQKIDVKEAFELSGTFIVDVPDHTVFEDFRKVLIESDLFISVTEDKTSEQVSGYENYIYSAHWWLGNIKAAEAWAQLPTTGYVDVAVMDGDGCETTHPDLIGRFNLNWNCSENNANVDPQSDNEKHGTPCSGIVAANCANNQYVLSAGNDRLRVQFLRIGYNQSGGSFYTSDSILTLAVNKAIANPDCAVISMSWGGGSPRPNFENALNIARTQGRGGKGIAICASSGNQSLADFSQLPASYSSVMAIGATGTTNTKASFSNYGPKLFAAAPGTQILTTDRTGGKGYKVNADPFEDAVTYFSGTSAACPVFAACIGTMVLANPNITESQIRTILQQTCRKIGGYTYTNGKSLELGYGIIDQNAAVLAAIQGGVNPPPPNPIPNLTLIVSAPSTAVSGSIVPVNFTVNASVSIATPLTFNVTFYRSLDGSIDSSDVLVATVPVTLPASQLSAYGSFNLTLPPNTTGNIYVIGNVDSTNVVPESNENDNLASAVINVTASPGPGPTPTGLDLGVQLLQYGYNTSGTLYFRWKLTNHGSVPITNFKYVRGFIGGTQMTSTSNQYISPGQSFTYQTSWFNLPTSYPGTYKITITEVNGVLDSITSNNVSTITVNQP